MDKQDELAAIILAGLREPLALESGSVPTPNQIRSAAAAVRSFMGSPEVVSRAEHAAARIAGVGVGSLDVPVVQMTRAALSAALGEDIGGLK